MCLAGLVLFVKDGELAVGYVGIVVGRAQRNPETSAPDVSGEPGRSRALNDSLEIWRIRHYVVDDMIDLRPVVLCVFGDAVILDQKRARSTLWDRARRMRVDSWILQCR